LFVCFWQQREITNCAALVILSDCASSILNFSGYLKVIRFHSVNCTISVSYKNAQRTTVGLH